jgi:hypothetical protein
MLAFSLAGDQASAFHVGNLLLQKRQRARDLAYKQAGLQARFEQESRLRQRLLHDIDKERADVRDADTKNRLAREKFEHEKLTDEQKAAVEERDTRQKVYTKAITDLRTDVEQVMENSASINIGALGKSLVTAGFIEQVQLIGVAQQVSKLGGDEESTGILSKGIQSGELFNLVKGAMETGVQLNQHGFATGEDAAAERDRVSTELANLYLGHLSTLDHFPEERDRFIRNAGYMIPSKRDAAVNKAHQILGGGQPTASVPSGQKTLLDAPSQSTEAGSNLPALSSEEVFDVVSEFGSDLALALTDEGSAGALDWNEWNDLAATVAAVMKQENLEPGVVPEGGTPEKAVYNDVLMHLDDQINMAVMAVDAQEPFPDEASKELFKGQLEDVFVEFLQTGRIPVQPPPLAPDTQVEAPHVPRTKVKKASEKIKGGSAATKARRAKVRAKVKFGPISPQPKAKKGREVRTAPSKTPLIGRTLSNPGTTPLDRARLQQDSARKAQHNMEPGLLGFLKPNAVAREHVSKAHAKVKALNPRSR